MGTIKNSPLKVEKIGGDAYVVAGIGYMFYTHGLPMEVSIKLLKEQGLSISVLSIYDELVSFGFSQKKAKAAIIESLRFFQYNDEKVKELIDMVGKIT